MSEEKILGKHCIWCGGTGEVVCALCDQLIVCWFCDGKGDFIAEPRKAAHLCPVSLAAMATEGGVQ